MAASRGQPVCRKEDCSPFDIGTVFTTIGRFTNAAKFRFIENLWKPEALHDFLTSVETSGSLRKFRLECRQDDFELIFTITAIILQ